MVVASSKGFGSRVPAPVLFVVGGVSMYVGAALAVGLFDRLSPSAVAVLRILAAGLLLLLVVRPGRVAWSSGRLRRSVPFGVATALMNAAFYEAIARLPLGTTVALEFCGPVAVAAALSRRPRDVGAVVLAAGGVALIADVRWSGSPSGVVWALAAAALWAAYIVLGKRVARGGSGIDDMAVGFAVAGLLCSPLLVPPVVRDGWSALAPLAEPRVLVLVLGVGLLSSIVPYGLDQVVLRRVGQARFAVLLALLPATATVIGVVVLGQLPGVAEAVGIALVVGAVLLRSRDGDTPPETPPAPSGSRSVTTRRGDAE
ncbi:EamA family transporter [Pseudonocardia oroxyli]|uniref:Inner membrane transporter RhtA n=1 Tax=Pseudonocardia oroxyli TaxID=366584 RepID=A0A1G7YHV7_PSEOR|nr:EamA family transporter [Pseudonocardia oroxyli]SDG95876.1 inner membrane transporter RhtA [Pseudonocardia oroxyli]